VWPQERHWENRCEIQGDSQEMTDYGKIFNDSNSGAKSWNMEKATQIHLNVVIKTFAISLPSQPFLGCHLGFHILFHNNGLGDTHFLTAGLFWIRSYIHNTTFLVNSTALTGQLKIHFKKCFMLLIFNFC